VNFSSFRPVRTSATNAATKTVSSIDMPGLYSPTALVMSPVLTIQIARP
jgi:hypothetical protein